MLKILLSLGVLLILSPTLATGAEVGFYCTSDKECEHYRTENIYSECKDFLCKCHNNKTFLPTECRPQVIRTNNLIGGFCPCSLPHAECKDQICYCEAGFVPTDGKRRCIPEAVPLGEACETDQQCMALHVFSHCANDTKRCTCNHGFDQMIQTSCLSRTKLRPECNDSLNCLPYGSHLMCLPDARECVCEPGFVSSNTSEQCIPVRAYNQECNDTIQCLAIMGHGASCSEGKCGCENEYEVVKKKHADEMICKRLAVIGQYCRTDEHCHNGRATNRYKLLECNRGECVCRFGIKNQSPCSFSVATSLIASELPIWLMLILLIFLFTYM